MFVYGWVRCVCHTYRTSKNLFRRDVNFDFLQDYVVLVKSLISISEGHPFCMTPTHEPVKSLILFDMFADDLHTNHKENDCKHTVDHSRTTEFFLIHCTFLVVGDVDFMMIMKSTFFKKRWSGKQSQDPFRLIPLMMSSNSCMKNVSFTPLFQTPTPTPCHCSSLTHAHRSTVFFCSQTFALVSKDCGRRFCETY
jgi:hypothetical protein